jgi:hypothetical protein
MDKKSLQRGLGDDDLRRLSEVVTAPELLTAFGEAALRDDVWDKAQADPAAYLEGRGLRLPEGLEVAFTEDRLRRPWPRPEPDLQMVVIRCFWVWGKEDPDDEKPKPPTRFCLQIPAFLLDYIRQGL